MHCYLLLSALYTFLLIPFSAAVNTYTNPLKATDGSDPFMVYDGGYYYLTTTTWTNIQITRATTISGLKTAKPVTVWSDSTASRCCNVWAPELHKINGIWYLYYAAGTSDGTGNQRPFVLQGVAANPMGPYTFKAQLSATNAANVWGIDGTVATISGKSYFIYSSFSPNNLQSLYIAPMTNAYTLGARSLISEPTLSWETVSLPVNEGPQALYNGSQIWLTYSASACWTPSYSLGLLTWTGGDPTQQSSWSKQTSGPVFSTANGDYGPGHNGFFTSPDGHQTYLVYHSSTSSTVTCDGNRRTEAQPLYWHTNGAPDFGSPRAVTDNIPVPPGE